MAKVLPVQHAYVGALSLASGALPDPTWQALNLDQLATEASRLRVLVVGGGVSAMQLSQVLPSVRTINPTMSVIGLGSDRTIGADVRAWVDETVESIDEVRDKLDERLGRSPTRMRALARSTAATSLLALATLVAIWWGTTALFQLPPYLLPSPDRVAAAFAEQPQRFLGHVLTTAFEALIGFLVGNMLGIGLAIVLTRYLRLRAYTMPVLISLQAIPIVAFAPLLGVWLGTGFASKIAMAAIICFFPMVVNSLQAFASVESEYLELFHLYKANFRTTLRRLLFPASASAMVAALKISAGLAVVGAIVAEMTGADRGLGYLILNGAYRLETDVLFVAMFLSGALGVCFFQVPELIRWSLPRAWVRGAEDHSQNHRRTS